MFGRLSDGHFSEGLYSIFQSGDIYSVAALPEPRNVGLHLQKD
jgi:hypothetical protein